MHRASPGQVTSAALRAHHLFSQEPIIPLCCALVEMTNTSRWLHPYILLSILCSAGRRAAAFAAAIHNNGTPVKGCWVQLILLQVIQELGHDLQREQTNTQLLKNPLGLHCQHYKHAQSECTTSIRELLIQHLLRESWQHSSTSIILPQTSKQRGGMFECEFTKPNTGPAMLDDPTWHTIKRSKSPGPCTHHPPGTQTCEVHRTACRAGLPWGGWQGSSTMELHHP